MRKRGERKHVFRVGQRKGRLDKEEGKQRGASMQGKRNKKITVFTEEGGKRRRTK